MAEAGLKSEGNAKDKESENGIRLQPKMSLVSYNKMNKGFFERRVKQFFFR